ncbi:glycoside hydrolase family 65 protein [uncultured Corynebacterium sp.]|uniref:glycoside hydrolase family 65 protein n=1 Tax=uncultured Corynebacterium sp. TaxID=159447 RepID=UPI0025E09A7B|nr:glycosyl hydrolase family 65 protein [uncultured Corynebacterium sp.]
MTDRTDRNDHLEEFLAQRRRVASVVNRPVGDGSDPADPADYFPPGYRTDVHLDDVDPLELVDRSAHPVDEWGWHERRPGRTDEELGLSETLFSLSNGYLGLRGNPPEGRDSHEHGTFINGVHETWNIEHAEDAYGFAREGQTIVQVPDAKAMRLYIDDEPLRLGVAEVEDYGRTLDFREGVERRSFIWRTQAGKRVRVVTDRMVSFQERHLALMSLEVELLDADAAVVISSQILNRQDGEDEFSSILDTYASSSAAADRADAHAADVNGGADPRKAEKIAGRVFQPTYRSSSEDQRVTLGYRVTNSGMTVAVSMDHVLDVTQAQGTGGSGVPASSDAVGGVEMQTEMRDDVARVVYHVDGTRGLRVRLEKFVSYHSSRHVSAEELAFRCARTINRARQVGYRTLQANQAEWLGRFWRRSDVRVTGKPELQQAVRWNLFQLIQASARAETQGIPAKGLTGSGYGGHYFWDTEVYALPFLTYTSPQFSRNALRFRYLMLPQARERARELSHDGVLFPWRTINGHESSAYYAAGTAQYHIDADITYALMKYVHATGDVEFLLDEGIDILVGTARFFMSLGFFDPTGEKFQIHSVTGPDEYTTVVNNNLYTNVMAQYNLRVAADVARQMCRERPEAFQLLADRTGLSEDELDLWDQAAAAMYVPFDERMQIHPQDDQFLNRQLWNLDDPAVGAKRPLLLHYHPLTIYRYQVLKQADVVLALFLQGSGMSTEVKKRDYAYYDRLTTGDSSLSAVVQSIMAAELGFRDTAMSFFLRGLFLDLENLHGNSADGVHIASCGGVWSALVFGFGGFRDDYGRFSIEPRLPAGWESLEYNVTLQGYQVRVAVREGSVELRIVGGGDGLVGPVTVLGRDVVIGSEPVRVEGDTTLVSDEDGLAETVAPVDVVFVEK